MNRTQELIEKNSKDHKWLLNLNNLLNQIEHQSVHSGDTLIECSKSFIETIAKNIILKLKPDSNQKEINLLDLGKLFKKTQECIAEHSMIENIMPMRDIDNYFTALKQWVRFLGDIRNNTGEVSHGKFLPKDYSISLDVAIIVAETTDRLSYLLLLFLLQIDSSYTNNYIYEENQDFNEFLDEQFELPNNLNYSKALYDQDYDAYAEELDNYRDLNSI